MEITREGILYGIPRPSHPAYSPPEYLDNRSCAFWAPTKSDPLTTRSRDAVGHILLRNPGVIRWIDNNTYEAQDVQLDADVVSTNPTFTQEFWTATILMKNNWSVNHWKFRVLMDGTVENIGFPTIIPPDLNRVTATG